MSDLGLWVVCFLVGGAVAGVYLAMLWAGVRSLAGRGSIGIFALLTLLRGGVLILALALAVVFDLDAGGFLAALAGFVVVRIAATRRIGTGRGEAV